MIHLTSTKKKGHEYQSLSTKKSHCTNQRMMKTEHFVMVNFDSISLRTKFKKKRVMNINSFKPIVSLY